MTYFFWLSVRTYRLPASSRHHRKSDERRTANENMNVLHLLWTTALLTSNFVSIAKSSLFYVRQHLDYWLCCRLSLGSFCILSYCVRIENNLARAEIWETSPVIMAKCHLACSLLITAPYSVQFQVCVVRTIRFPARFSWALTAIHICAAGSGTGNEQLTMHRIVVYVKFYFYFSWCVGHLCRMFNIDIDCFHFVIAHDITIVQDY